MRKINLPYDYLIVHNLHDLKALLNEDNIWMWAPKTIEIIKEIIKNKSNPV